MAAMGTRERRTASEGSAVAEPETAPRQEAAIARDALSPAVVTRMKEGAGNAAVARMLSGAGASGRPVLARELDFTLLARQIHTAVDGLGTDEDAIYAALGQLNRDATATATLASTYLAAYGESLEEALRDDLSGSELTRALGLLGTATAAAPVNGTTPPAAIAPETTATTPSHPPARQLQMDLASGEAVLSEAFGTIKRIVPGSIQILEQAAFQAAYDRIYGAGPYSWAAYVAPTYGNLNGFADAGVNYINRSTAGLHTVVHEMLHNNTAADWRAVVGSRWDEGTTEVLTQIACARVSEPAPVCYPGESPVVREALAQGLPQDDLTSAYLTGGAQAKVAGWVDANCTENWAAVKGHMEAQDWAAARAGLRHRA
jgi:hypothetical protein